MNENEKFSYAIGLSVAGNLIGSGVKDVMFDPFFEAIKDAFNGQMPKITPEEANATIQSFLAKAQEEAASQNVAAGAAFMAENAKKEGVVALENGLQYEVINQGDGELPTLESQVKCHYHGTLLDGTVFDSSVERNDPATFPLNGVIKGWQEALQLMPVGSKWKLFIPSELAYGPQGAGGAIGPNATLIFEVELLEIV